MNNVTKTFICDCHSLEHQIVISYWPDDEEYNRELYIQVHLSNRSFWKRLKQAIRYIFGYPCKYGHWEEVLLDREKVDEVREFLEEYERSFVEKV